MLSEDHLDAQAAARGATQYNTLCVACHGAEGAGNPLLGSPNLTNDIWLYGGSADDTVEATIRWNQARAATCKLIEVRGQLPAQITLGSYSPFSSCS